MCVLPPPPPPTPCNVIWLPLHGTSPEYVLSVRRGENGSCYLCSKNKNVVGQETAERHLTVFLDSQRVAICMHFSYVSCGSDVRKRS